MSSTQRSIVVLAGSVGAAGAITGSTPWKVPAGANVGGIEVRTTLGSGGAFNLGSVGAKLQATNQVDEAGELIESPTWVDVPGGTVAPAAAVLDRFTGDGNYQVDVSAFLWLRLLPTTDTTSGTPAFINVTAYGKFDYQRG